MKLKVWRDPYGCGANITVPKEIELFPGLTVLVGCNGAGKTTLLLNIKEQAQREHIPCHMFDNLVDGGNSSIAAYLGGGNYNDLSLGISAINSSEGERIRINLAKQSTFYKTFMIEGQFKDKRYDLAKIFGSSDDSVSTKDRILLYDAVDSGMSIDAVQDIKNFFHTLINDATAMGINLYIIISANEFELCLHENCLDVISGKYREFYTYPKFKTFILSSRKAKERRLDRQQKWAARQRDKEKARFEVMKKSFEDKLEKVKEGGGREISVSDKHKLNVELDKLYNFSRNCMCCNFGSEVQELRNSLYKLYYH